MDGLVRHSCSFILSCYYLHFSCEYITTELYSFFSLLLRFLCVNLYSVESYDVIEQLEHIVWTHEKFFETGENERYLTKLDMHIFFPRELQLLFLAAGFSIEAIYGGYDWAPFGRGTRQIVVGRKRKD